MSAPRIVIVGAGPSGVRAAQTLVEAGLSPIVIDEAERSGGQIYRRQPAHFTRGYQTLYGSEARKAQDIHGSFEAIRHMLDYRPNRLVWGLFDGHVQVTAGGATEAIAYDALILATGATDRIMPLPGWTLPGVYSLGASQIALKAQGCAIGERVVFMGTGPLLYLVAYQYLKAGNPPLAVLDTSSLGNHLSGLWDMAARPGQIIKGMRYIRALKAAGVTLYSGITPLQLQGTPSSGVGGIRFESRGREIELACNAVGMGYHLRSESQLADLAGCDFSFDPLSRQWFPKADPMGRSSVRHVYLAGDGSRLLGADGAEISGQLAALSLLADHQFVVSSRRLQALLRESLRHQRFARGIQKAFPWPSRLANALPDETLVCRCEAITAGELRLAAGPLDAGEVNRAKAFSRVGMGRCQGRYCGQASQEIIAAARQTPIEISGRLRGQAPVKPLSIATTALDGSDAQ